MEVWLVFFVTFLALSINLGNWAKNRFFLQAAAIYIPNDTLVCLIEESPGLLMLSSSFLLRNSDGDHLFSIKYKRRIGSTNFTVKNGFINKFFSMNSSREMHILS